MGGHKPIADRKRRITTLNRQEVGVITNNYIIKMHETEWLTL